MAQIESAFRAKHDWQRFVLFVAFALIGLTYWNALQCGFVYDDNWQVVRNPLIQHVSLWKTALTSDVWAFKSSSLEHVSNYYRPVFTAWSIGNFVLFRFDPMGWHISNILLHALATYLGFLVLVRLKVKPVVAAVVTWVFAAHPVHVESVTWIAGSPDILMSVFLFYSLWVYLGIREAPTAKGWALALGAMFLAMGSKEASMMFFLVILIGEWALSKQESRNDGPARAVKAALPYVLVSLAFFVIRFRVTHQAGINAQNHIGLPSVLLSIPEALAFYIRQALIPYQLSTAYPLRAVSADSLTLANFYGPFAVVAASGVAMVLAARKSAALAIGAATTLLLAPSLYFRAFHVEHMVRDRYFYFPLFGIVLVLVGWLALKFEKSGSDAFRWSPLAIGGLAVSTVFAFLSMDYNKIWVSDATMWKRGIDVDPNGSFAMMNLAEGLRKTDPQAALPYAHRAVELNKKEARPLTILGMVQRNLNDYPDAERSLKAAIAIGRDTVIAVEQLAGLYQDQRRYDEAVAVFEGEIKRSAGYKPKGRINIGRLRKLEGKNDLAIEALESVRSDMERILTPDVQTGWFYLAQLYDDKGDKAKSADAYRRFLQGTPGGSTREIEEFRKTAEVELQKLGG